MKVECRASIKCSHSIKKNWLTLLKMPHQSFYIYLRNLLSVISGVRLYFYAFYAAWRWSGQKSFYQYHLTFAYMNNNNWSSNSRLIPYLSNNNNKENGKSSTIFHGAYVFVVVARLCSLVQFWEMTFLFINQLEDDNKIFLLFL